jgi:hypothetical protein
VTGQLTAQPVLNVIVGHGDKHLIQVVTAPAPDSALADGQVPDDDPRADVWTATANHPIWVQDQGWTDADDLAIGDLLQGAAGELRVVQDLDDEGWVHGQTVYNLSVANVHTFIVGDTGGGTLVHNSSCPHGNSLGFMGPTHVYQVVRHHPGGATSIHKYGKGGFVSPGGYSPRAARSARQAQREFGADRSTFSYQVLRRTTGTAAARRIESAMIRMYEGRFTSKPRGNIRG